MTIDPPGSLDLDQAVHLERTAEGVVLRYAIADVPRGGPPRGALDAETRRRGQTYYLPDGRIPLHPAVLSEGAASLLPGQARRALVWTLALDERAEPGSVRLERALVRSTARLDYESVQRDVDAGTTHPSIALLPWFGRERLEREAERGGASLTLPEEEIVAVDAGYRIERRAPWPSRAGTRRCRSSPAWPPPRSCSTPASGSSAPCPPPTPRPSPPSAAAPRRSAPRGRRMSPTARTCAVSTPPTRDSSRSCTRPRRSSAARATPRSTAPLPSSPTRPRSPPPTPM
ncbi:RNB domain-containing ribonuclease [Rathayibacter oskolensis]|uniref:RNB domain-containing ribonuclease n=1 Tax=Rathayibacter oskolensis TaxID=1891671 RepID=UPI00265F7621|nr:RNB domain-containing ribonuclease [Rathayibacter oskolensis]WKK71660.1 RNB domain-containing ribonuclease [Rathayibacter oskolensis]